MSHRDRTCRAFGRTWSHRNFYGLMRACLDAYDVTIWERDGIYGVEFWLGVALGTGPTPWLALCEAVEKMTAREAGEKMEEK